MLLHGLTMFLQFLKKWNEIPQANLSVRDCFSVHALKCSVLSRLCQACALPLAHLCSLIQLKCATFQRVLGSDAHPEELLGGKCELV